MIENLTLGTRFEGRLATLKSHSWSTPWMVGRPAEGADIRAGFRHMPVGSGQLIEQHLCLFEVGGVEPFGEPAIDRRKHVGSFGAAARNSQSLASCSWAMLRDLRYSSSAAPAHPCRSSN